MSGTRAARGARPPSRRARQGGFRKELPEASPRASPRRAFLARARDAPLRADISGFGTENLLTTNVHVVVLATITPPTQVAVLVIETTIAW